MAHILTVRLATNREAVDELILAAEACQTDWTAPRAPGKWSPSQLVEHVALTLEESAKVFAGMPSRFPTVPAPLRPVARAVFFDGVLQKGQFPNAKANDAMEPAFGPATPREALHRLQATCSDFEAECRALAARSDRVTTGMFGEVRILDYVRFTELHTRHHVAQMPRQFQCPATRHGSEYTET